MRRWILVAIASAATAVGWGGAATLADQPAPAPIQVGAYGNVIAQANLRFAPGDVTAKVGQEVVWTNRDVLVPHTATEDHHLWDLAGAYGQTPINPAGFGPGKTVQRVFEAGTEHYFCRVHPKQMHGVIRVPVTLALQTVAGKRRKHHKRRTITYVVATWAAAPPAAGEVFDVRVARASGAWQTFRDGTGDASAQFRAGVRGTVWHVEARLRRVADATQAADWSPDAAVTG
ncbi:MAG: blue (type 1) copper domain protein [Solirubrobacterales bacterium]|nr:blue (type 1) copper domain protein [Solirubrobacterales bacterium]